jgi:hypothetical protein
MACFSLLGLQKESTPKSQSSESPADSIGRNWTQFNATVAETERLLNTEYHYYEHDIEGGYRIACDEYHLPEGIRKHVDFVVCFFLTIDIGKTSTDLR